MAGSKELLDKEVEVLYMSDEENGIEQEEGKESVETRADQDGGQDGGTSEEDFKVPQLGENSTKKAETGLICFLIWFILPVINMIKYRAKIGCHVIF